MIETNILSEMPAIVLHRVSGRMSETVALAGVSDALSIITTLAKKQPKFGLLLDMRGYLIDDLAAHRLWSTGFKEHALLRMYVRAVAVVGDRTPKAEAEKGCLESDTIKFFYELDAAETWLRNE